MKNTAVTPDIQTSQLVDMSSPAAVLEETKYNFIHSYPVKEFTLIREVFKIFVDLFEGRYPGYKKCNTPYHDIYHSFDTVLVFSRIADGYNIEKKRLNVHKLKIALISIIFHDSGYIQKIADNKGTGAKHSKVHELKSIEFIRSFFKKIGLSRDDFLIAKNMIHCTDLKINPGEIEFKSPTEKILGYMVGTADLVGQMAERTYLEKLSLLFREFKEGDIPGYDSEYDLMKKTLYFYDNIAKKRMDVDFDGMYRYLHTHFRVRYNLDSNLYFDAIDKQLNYLRNILDVSSQNDYTKKLRRRGLRNE
ncbi:hypothetical protein ACFLTD_04500 [Elusimicrobiota bacterium]